MGITKKILVVLMQVNLILACDLSGPKASAEKEQTTDNAPLTAAEEAQATRQNHVLREEVRGVTWEDLKPGEGDRSSADGSVMKVQYKVWLKESGALVEDSRNRSEESFQFTLGESSVISGWDQGLSGMKKGGIRRLMVPSDMAYGKRGISGLIPPDSDLIFEITLVDLP